MLGRLHFWRPRNSDKSRRAFIVLDGAYQASEPLLCLAERKGEGGKPCVIVLRIFQWFMLIGI